MSKKHLMEGWSRRSQCKPDIKLVSRTMFHATGDLNRKQHRCERFQQHAAGNSEPAHDTCFLGSSASNRLIITPAYYGNEPNGPNRGNFF
jgi:hypothetical protein